MVIHKIRKSRALHVDTDLIKALIIIPPLYPIFKTSLPILILPLIMHSDLTPSISPQLQAKWRKHSRNSFVQKFPNLIRIYSSWTPTYSVLIRLRQH